MRVRLVPCLSLANLCAAALAAQEAPSPKPFVTGQLGAFVLAVPAYPGSDERWVLPVPIVDLRLARRVYVGAGASGVSGGAGIVLAETPALSWTADLTLMPDRPEKRADALVGLGNRGLGGFAGTTLALRRGPLQATASVAKGVEERMGAFATVGAFEPASAAVRMVRAGRRSRGAGGRRLHDVGLRRHRHAGGATRRAARPG